MTWNVGPSHVVPFIEACRCAASNDEAFASFRSQLAITQAMENTTESWGRRVWRAVHVFAPAFAERSIDTLLELSRICKPWLTITCDGYVFSPTTIRHWGRVWHLGVLRDWLNGAHIVEIGGGYGGLAAMVCKLFTPASYTILDLPEVQALQARFLDAYGVKGVIMPSHNEGIDLGSPVDLLISDCALSEQDTEGRNAYVPLMQQSRCGSFVWNIPSGEAATDPNTDWLRGEAVRVWLKSCLPASRVTNGLEHGPYKCAPSCPWRSEGHYMWFWEPAK